MSLHLFALLLPLFGLLPDKGIYPEYDATTALSIPNSLSLHNPWLRIDLTHRVATLYDGPDAIDAYPIITVPKAATTFAALSPTTVGEADFNQLRAHLRPESPVTFRVTTNEEDRDGDGIVDRLDILLGARKLLSNKAHYISSYHKMKYPGGDVPRQEGVCTDTIVRALRNAGIDLQKEVHEDILAAPRAYPMIGKADANIDHRRVKVLLPWLKRHFTEIPGTDRSLPGDIVLFDTFPSKPGPDHIGIISDRERDGTLLVINNWTDGATDAEMELLSWVPVTHRFRPTVPAQPR